MSEVQTISTAGTLSNTEEKNLGTIPVKKLVPLYCLPLIIGSLIIGLQLVVDLIILSTGVNQEAIAAVGLLFPYFLIMAVLYDLIGPGGCAIVTEKRSKGDLDGARRVVAQSILSCFVVTAIISVLSYIFMDEVIWGLGGTDILYAPMVTFLKIFLIWMPFMTTGVVVFYMIRADERPILGGIFNVVPGIIAMVAEYLMVFNGGMGIAASAWGAVIALVPNALLILWFIFGKSKLHLRPSDFKPKFRMWGYIGKIGFPSCAIQLFYTVVMIVAANILESLGASVAETAAYSVIDAYIYYFLTFIVFGFGLGIQPIVSYNFGRVFKRALQTLKIAVVSGLATMVLIVALMYIFIGGLSNFFAAGDAEYAVILKQAIAYYSWGIPFLIITCTTMYFLQAAEKAGVSTLVIFMRAFVFTIPLLYIFSAIMGVKGIFLAFPVAEVISAIAALIVIKWQIKKLEAVAEKQNLDMSTAKNENEK